MVSNLKMFEDFPKGCGLDELMLSSRWKQFQIELLISFVLEIGDKLVRMKLMNYFISRGLFLPGGQNPNSVDSAGSNTIPEVQFSK